MIVFGPAPRCRIPDKCGRGKDHDILQVGCIWTNLNNKDADGGAVEVIRRIDRLPLRPSVVVNSGYGHQVYFLFHSPLRAGKLLSWSDMMQGLSNIMRADGRISLSRMMGLPGTLNLEEKDPVPCEIL